MSLSVCKFYNQCFHSTEPQSPSKRQKDRQREAEKVSEDEKGEGQTNCPLSLTVWCWGVPRTAVVVGGWREGTGGATGPHTVLPHLDACRSDVGWGWRPAAACGASWSGRLKGAQGEILLTDSLGTADPDAAGAHPALLVRPGCRARTCQGRGVQHGVGGRSLWGDPRGDGC